MNSILCIDIGLKNLAMCIMNHDTTIKLWEVYNTIPEQLCSGVQKNGKICGKKCTMFSKNLGYFCKLHSPKDTKPYKQKNSKTLGLQEIAQSLLNSLDTIFYNNKTVFLELKKICIELQPKINPKMKFASHVVYTKFLELYNKENASIDIKFIGASRKLKSLAKVEKNTYAKRKVASVEYTKTFLQNICKNGKEWFYKIEDCKKKDDLADSLLMCVNQYKIKNLF